LQVPIESRFVDGDLLSNIRHRGLSTRDNETETFLKEGRNATSYRR
jgi:hypothetical protein